MLLCVLMETHPTVHHAPGIPVLVCLLLLFMSAEEAYATVACLLHISAMYAPAPSALCLAVRPPASPRRLIRLMPKS